VSEWWREVVYYQVYPWSFQDDDGNGIGDLRGITRRLPYLRETLGVDVVWLSPFYRSPMHDMGYDVADHCDVDPRFGGLEDVDHLIAEAHRLGLRVVVDFVPNHTSSDHRWFVASSRSRKDPKADWYVWRDGRDGGPPNNWLSIFGGSSWSWHPGREQYYLHSFLPEQPDLDWRNPEVREAMQGVLDFWLDRGVDGFRIDVAHFIAKDPALRDNPPNPSGEGVYHKPVGEYETQHHVHDLGHPDGHAFHAEIRRRVSSRVSAPVLLGEIHLQDDLERWAGYFGSPEAPELHLPFNFGLLSVPFEADAIAAHVEAIERVTSAPGRWPTYVLGNHDERRLRSRVGTQNLRAAAALLLTLRGSPTLYYGDELGMPEVDVPPAERQDPWGKRVPGQNLGRDGCRTPMRWDASTQAGFTAGQSWLPLGPEVETVNVAHQLHEPSSLLQAYRALLRLRRETSALRLGALENLHARDDVLVYERCDGARRVGVEMNLGPRSHPARYASPVLLRLTPSTVERAPASVPAELHPGEVRVVSLSGE